MQTINDNNYIPILYIIFNTSVSNKLIADISEIIRNRNLDLKQFLR